MTVAGRVETDIRRPPADVFAALVDVERYPSWLIASGIVRVERLDPGPLAAGSRCGSTRPWPVARPSSTGP